jgi:hypothetical protein
MCDKALDRHAPRRENRRISLVQQSGLFSAFFVVPIGCCVVKTIEKRSARNKASALIDVTPTLFRNELGLKIQFFCLMSALPREMFNARLVKFKHFGHFSYYWDVCF